MQKITRVELVKSNQGAGDSNPNSSRNDNCHFNVLALNGHTYYFRASSPTDAQEWVDTILAVRYPEKAPSSVESLTAATSSTLVITSVGTHSDPAIISTGALVPHIAPIPTVQHHPAVVMHPQVPIGSYAPVPYGQPMYPGFPATGSVMYPSYPLAQYPVMVPQQAYPPGAVAPQGPYYPPAPQ